MTATTTQANATCTCGHFNAVYAVSFCWWCGKSAPVITPEIEARTRALREGLASGERRINQFVEAAAFAAAENIGGAI